MTRYKSRADSVYCGRSKRLRVTLFLCALAWIGSVGTVVPRADGPQAPPAAPPTPARTQAQAQAAAPAATPAAPTPSIVAATVKDYCAACHNERTKTGGLVLTNLDPANVPADAGSVLLSPESRRSACRSA